MGQGNKPATRRVVYDQTLMIDQATLQLAQEYARATGRSASSVVREALEDWFSTIGAARLEAHQERPTRPCNNLVSITSKRAAS